MEFQVPSPPHASKSPNGGKVPTFEPQEGIKIWLIFVEVGYRLLYAKQFLGLVLRVGFGFLLNPTLNTSPEPQGQYTQCPKSLEVNSCNLNY